MKCSSVILCFALEMFTNLRYVLFEKQSNLDNNRPKLEVARFLGNPNSQFFFEELSHYQVKVVT